MWSYNALKWADKEMGRRFPEFIKGAGGWMFFMFCKNIYGVHVEIIFTGVIIVDFRIQEENGY